MRYTQNARPKSNQTHRSTQIMNPSENLSRIFFALSEQTRRDILTQLVHGDLNVSEIAKKYEISLPAISKHLRSLEDAKLIEIQKSGRSRIVTLRPETLTEAQIWLNALYDEENFLNGLEAEIEAISSSSQQQEPLPQK